MKVRITEWFYILWYTAIEGTPRLVEQKLLPMQNAHLIIAFTTCINEDASTEGENIFERPLCSLSLH